MEERIGYLKGLVTRRGREKSWAIDLDLFGSSARKSVSPSGGTVGHSHSVLLGVSPPWHQDSSCPGLARLSCNFPVTFEIIRVPSPSHMMVRTYE